MQSRSGSGSDLDALLAAIVADDGERVASLLRAHPALASTPTRAAHLYESGIFHWLYAGDTALHLAAAGHRSGIAGQLLTAGAGPNIAGRHRNARPLHYAADGYITGPEFNAEQQIETLRTLLDADAEIDAQDKNGATPLHRAVRTRSAKAVRYLLTRGANAHLRNRSGSSAFHLAAQTTGRGGTGADAAIDAQRDIITTFLSHGVSPHLRDGSGKSVLDWARSDWVRALIASGAADTKHTFI